MPLRSDVAAVAAGVAAGIGACPQATIASVRKLATRRRDTWFIMVSCSKQTFCFTDATPDTAPYATA
jgi:hypothetical protein